MAEIDSLDIVDGNNTARWAEGQAPSTVNNGARALEGIIARWHEDTGARKSSTGSANAYVFAAAQTLSAYYDGLEIGFDANFTNTGSATLNVDSIGAKTIKKNNDVNLASGDIESGQKVFVVYDCTSFQMKSHLGNAGGGAWAVVTSGTATTVTELDFTTIASDKITRFYLYDLVISAARRVYMRTSTDGGSTFAGGAANYDGSNTNVIGTTELHTNLDSDAEIRLTVTDSDADALWGMTIDVMMIGHGDATRQTAITYFGKYEDTGNNHVRMWATNIRAAAEDVDAVRFTLDNTSGATFTCKYVQTELN